MKGQLFCLPCSVVQKVAVVEPFQDRLYNAVKDTAFIQAIQREGRERPLEGILAAVVLDVVYDVASFALGHDLLTGEKLSHGEELFTAVAIAIPVVSIAAVKHGGRLLQGGKQVATGIDGVGDAAKAARHVDELTDGSRINYASALESGLTRKIQRDLVSSLDEGGVIALRSRPYRAAGLEWKYPAKGPDVTPEMVVHKYRNGVRELVDGRKVLSDLDVAGYTISGKNINDEDFLDDIGFASKFNETYGHDIIAHGTLTNGISRHDVRANLSSRIQELTDESVYVFNKEGFVETLPFKHYLAKYNSESVIKFYHGTDEIGAQAIRKGIDLDRGRLELDFNPTGKGGFYVTGNLSQAEVWAERIAKRSGNQPNVLEFIIPQSEFLELNGRVFGQADVDDWARFVIEGRRGTLQHSYDFVEGPMLANSAKVREGHQPVPHGHQVAIFSDKAVRLFQHYLQP
ncbi:MAG: DUF3990 domain-containing protein [Anaerolineae bacterium]|nr:DUF3990 domain-containing protein [Anaerolineae bacterium]